MNTKFAIIVIVAIAIVLLLIYYFLIRKPQIFGIIGTKTVTLTEYNPSQTVTTGIFSGNIDISNSMNITIITAIVLNFMEGNKNNI
jgi:hypothetical protein